jgi:hypothetical protein
LLLGLATIDFTELYALLQRIAIHFPTRIPKEFRVNSNYCTLNDSDIWWFRAPEFAVT